MFARASSIVVLALPFLAVASIIPRGENQCNTGSMQCCNSVENAQSPTAAVGNLLGLFGLTAGSLTGQVGVTCSPLSGVGVNSNSCTAQPVCCTNNSFNGVIAIGCTPINIHL